MASLTKDEWKDRIAPHLSTSLQAVSDKITQTEEVQTWLQRASLNAAEGLEQLSGVQGKMRGYMQMMEDLEESLPNLVAAVDDLTAGCGAVDLQWRPLQPNFSRLYLSFDRDYKVEVFCRLSACREEAARETLTIVAGALSAGDPFPNRPNTATGLAAREGNATGIRVKESLRKEESGTIRSVTLLPSNQNDIEDLSETEAARRLLQLLCSESES